MILGVSNKDELLENALQAASNAPKVYQKSVEYYYLTRHFVSIFEAYHHELPIQVWNEYRNALDHFFRHLTNVGLTPEEQEDQKGDHKSNQLKAMESHLIRAALDMLKIIATKGDDWYKDLQESHPEEMLALVDDGNFLTRTKQKYAEAIDLTIMAKTKDQHLGMSVPKSDKAIRAYVDAAYAYNELRELFNSNIDNISNARVRYKAICDHAEVKTHRKSFLPNVWAGIMATVLCTIVFAMFGETIASGWDKFVSLLSPAAVEELEKNKLPQSLEQSVSSATSRLPANDASGE